MACLTRGNLSECGTFSLLINFVLIVQGVYHDRRKLYLGHFDDSAAVLSQWSKAPTSLNKHGSVSNNDILTLPADEDNLPPIVHPFDLNLEVIRDWW